MNARPQWLVPHRHCTPTFFVAFCLCVCVCVCALSLLGGFLFLMIFILKCALFLFFWVDGSLFLPKFNVLYPIVLTRCFEFCFNNKCFFFFFLQREPFLSLLSYPDDTIISPTREVIKQLWVRFQLNLVRLCVAPCRVQWLIRTLMTVSSQWGPKNENSVPSHIDLWLVSVNLRPNVALFLLHV